MTILYLNTYRGPTVITFDHLLTFSFSRLALAVCLFVFFFFISFDELGTGKKKTYRLIDVGPMNSMKKLSDENKSDVVK